MDRDPARARMWLFSALSGSALLLWLLALLGLGGWVDEGEITPPPAWALPERETAVERLGALEAYAHIGARPLFNESRRPQPFVLDHGVNGNASGAEFALSGVLITPALNLAILTPDDGGVPVQVHLGEVFPGRPEWQLHTLAPRHAVFQTPDGPVRLDLRSVEDSQAPPVPAPAMDAGQILDSGPDPLNGRVHHQEHQARIEAVRRRVAERRTQLQAEQAEQVTSSHSNQ